MLLVVVDTGERQGAEAWRLSDFDQRATTRAADWMQKPTTFEFTSDTAIFELFDQGCIESVPGIDVQDEMKVRVRNAARRQDHVRAPRELLWLVAKYSGTCHGYRRRSRWLNELDHAGRHTSELVRAVVGEDGHVS